MHSDKIYRAILENMSDGVMTISMETSLIMTFNDAAEQILGLKREDVLENKFGAVFLLREENDEFNQTILNAVYESEKTHYNLVPYHTPDGLIRSLAVTTSYLDSPDEAKKHTGIIVVFTDMSEVERLQATEIQLAEELKAKHRDLQQSYQDLEESNTTLQTTLKKVQMVRIAATAFVIILFLAIGLFTWFRSSAVGRPAADRTVKDGGGTMRTIPVVTQDLKDSIAMKGTLKPVKIVNLTSPFNSLVKEKLFDYGQTVRKGQLLMRLDTGEAESRFREAKNAYIKAAEKLREMNDWGNSDDMAKTGRSVTRAKMAMDNQKRTFQDTEALFRKGIVSASEYSSAKQQSASATMDYESALHEQKITRAKGQGENLIIAKNEMENARNKAAELERQLRLANISAPVSGTILLPDLAADKDRKSKIMESGVTVSQGEILLSIGNSEGLAVTATIDEMEVMKVKVGQEAQIAGDAFPDTILKGRVSHVSSQAVKAGGDTGGAKTASFEISITVDEIPPEVQPRLRLGMSCSVEIFILNKPGVIMLPIAAVREEGKDRYVSVMDKATKTPRKVKVETGLTTVEAVEIVKGLKPGDEIVTP